MKRTSTRPAINKGNFTIKEKVLYTLAGVVILGGSLFIGRSLIRKARSNSEEKKTFEEGSPADMAKRLKMAFENDGWFGTDENAIRNVFRSVPSKDEFKKIITSYQKLYSSSLMADLKDELQSSEYNEMLAILSAKPEQNGQPLLPGSAQHSAWARRLKAAFDLSYGWFPGTDEDAIKAVFMEIPTQTAFQQVALAYKKEFGNDLLIDLYKELEAWERAEMMDIINKKPKS